MWLVRVSRLSRWQVASIMGAAISLDAAVIGAIAGLITALAGLLGIVFAYLQGKRANARGVSDPARDLLVIELRTQLRRERRQRARLERQLATRP